MRFEGAAGERKLLLDGNGEQGCSPMETLMISLAGCMAIDLVHILGRMRAEIRDVHARIEGTRADTDPRRFTQLKLHFEIEADGLKPENVERALALSREKYCSVWHSLSADIDRQISFELRKLGERDGGVEG